jgi:hypothetical protein
VPRCQRPAGGSRDPAEFAGGVGWHRGCTACVERQEAPMQERDTQREQPDFWSQLIYRWVLQHNPLYLISAGLVLAGLFLISRDITRSRTGGLGPELFLTAATELYQTLLIVAAALLYRRGRRRPATMLALLEVAYLGDLTFQTGVAPHLAEGLALSAAWLALSMLKLFALAWALRLRPSLPALLLPCLGAVGLATLPHLIGSGAFGERASAGLVVLWLFGLLAAGLWWRPTVASRDRLDAWGETVLRRAARVSFSVWATVAIGHSVWWSIDYGLRPFPGLLCAGVLLATRAVQRQRCAFLLVGIALLLAVTLDPESLSLTAGMAAAVLALSAWRRPATTPPAAVPASLHPYRAPSDPEVRPAPRPRLVLAAPPLAEARRFAIAAATSAHLAFWTAGWTGGALPQHRLWLDLALGLVLALLAWRGGRLLPSLVTAAILAHLGLQQGAIAAPRSTGGWGLVVLGLGFVVLVVGFLVSWFGRPAGEGPA